MRNVDKVALMSCATSRRRTALTVCLPLIVMGSCENGGDTADVMVRDSAGITIVENGPTSPNPTWTVSPTPVFEVGWSEGGPAFEYVSAGALLPDGGVVVGDDGAKTVFFLSRTGALVGHVGREGDGPGEFRGIISIVPLGSDTVLVQDYVSRRVQFLVGGQTDRVVRFVGEAGDAGQKIQGRLPDGSFALAPYSYRPGPNYEVGWLAFPLVSAPPDLGVMDTLSFVDVFEQRRRDDRNPVRYYGLIAFSGDRFTYVRTDRPEARWMDQDGSVKQIARWNPGARTVTDEDWQAHQAFVRSYSREGPALESLLQEEKAAFGGARPVARFTYGDTEGNIWLAEQTFAGPLDARFTVVTADGRVIGPVVFPRAIEPLAISADLVLAHDQNEWGVQAVVLYRLTK